MVNLGLFGGSPTEQERYYCSAKWCGKRKHQPWDLCLRCGNSGTRVQQRSGKSIPWSLIREARREEQALIAERWKNIGEHY